MDKTLISLETLKSRSVATSQDFRPIFYRPSHQREEFEKLLQTPGLFVVDRIRDQLREYVKLLNPSRRFVTDELERSVDQHLNGTHENEYGIWVFYPWSNRLVHLLDREEFIAVRTSRNQYKITPEERDILAKKRIGVIGLSVGQSVSVTLAMERICGEIRLADFDVLELTNLNRIRTGVHNLGLPKVYSVAREIAEIDPYITVKCFADGLHENNLDQFFADDGMLDLVVEESDGFDIKILARYKAREMRVPVIMEASDRCMVDVERYDLEPDRPILHGIVKHLDIATLKSLKTNEEKIPYMLDVLGIDSTSTRLRASMLEMQQSITTWPQLASAVTMGGGITADVSRRMLLDQFRSSGRYYVDVEQMIADKKTDDVEKMTSPPVPPDLLTLSRNIPDSRKKGTPLTRSDAEKLVAAACLAPSAGNQQPWRWIYRDNALFVFNPYADDGSLLSLDNNAPFMAIGAAATNIVVRAAQSGLSAELEFFPDSRRGQPVMAFHFSPARDVPEEDLFLAQAIESRVTNRTIAKRQVIPDQVLMDLQKTVSDFDPALRLRFFTDEKQLREQGRIMGELEKARLLDPAWHKEFVMEIRWTEEETNSTRDGIDLKTLDLTNSEKVGLMVARDPKVIAMINGWNRGEAFSVFAKKAIDSAGAVGMICSKDAGPARFLKAGMAMQRMWLAATLKKLSLQPMGAPVFMFAPLIQNKPGCVGPDTVKRLNQIRPDFEKGFEIGQGEKEVFIFRLGVLPEPPVRSLRKPVDEVFLYQEGTPS